MAESIKTRVRRVLAGGVNRLIEVIEGADQDTVLEQTVREIESALDEVRNELGRQLAQKHLATRRLFEANRKHDELQEKLLIAIDQKRDDLAEAAIAVQLDIEAQIPVIEQSLVDIEEREKELEGYLRALQGRISEMREEIVQYRAQRVKGLGGERDSEKNRDLEMVRRKVEHAEAAFERLIQRATGLPSGVLSSDVHTASKLAELEGMSRKNRIQERLAAHKASVSRSDDSDQD